MDVGTAYISIVPETSRIGPGIRSALGGAEREADRAGRSMGGRMSSALGGALKAGAATAGAAALAGIGATLTKGFQRLDAIDQAKAKLGALGNSAKDVDGIMKNALASVKGTAFGLGDAAGLAGTMVAAGIKPGRELESVLKTVADSAAVAGTDLNDMGQVFGKIAAKGKLDGETLDQLMERQIGILPELAKHYGVTTEEASKMVSDGKIKFADFAKVMQDKLGGGAVKMGETVRGAFENIKAAAGRVGASALEPFFQRLPGGFNGITTALDNLEPKVKALSAAFAEKVFTEWPDKIRGAIAALRENGVIDRTKSAFEGVKSAIVEIGPSIGRIVTELGKASAAVGVGSWQIFVTALQAGTTALNIMNPVLSTIADLMEAHPGLVMAAVAAWAAFKTIPAITSRVTGAVASLSSSVTGLAGSGGTLHAMRRAYSVASQDATRFGRSAGVAAAGMTGLRAAGSGVVGMFGGPMGIALAGATIGIGVISSEMAKSKQKAQEYAASVETVGATTAATASALKASRGEFTDTVFTAMNEQLDALINKTSKEWASGGTLGATALKDALNSLGMTTGDLTQKMAGSDAAWTAFRDSLALTNPMVLSVLPQLDAMRAKIIDQRDVAARVAPGISEFGKALDVLGDKSSSASEKLNAVKTAMDALNPARTKSEAIAQMGEAIRQATAAAQGMTPAAFTSKGVLDEYNESGAKLGETLRNLADKQAQVVANGRPEDIARANKEIEASLQGLAAATGQPIEKIRELYGTMGGGKNLDLLVQLKGAPEAVQQLGAVQAAMNATPNAKSIEVPTDQIQAALPILDQLKIKYTTMPDDKTIKIDVSGEAGAKLQNVINTANQVPPGKAIMTSAPGGQGVVDLLRSMGVEVQTNNDKTISASIPAGSPVLELLNQIGFQVENRNGKNVIVKADDTDYTSKKSANKWTETEFKEIQVRATDLTGRVSGRVGAIFGDADGSIVRAYMNGGISAAESFANGGLREIAKPKGADIFRGRGAGTIFAEEETGGEAYIPLAMSKRGRSTDILATVASMFGMSLVPKDSISGTLGAIAGGAVSKLLVAAGVDRVKRFADGGFNAKQLRELADGGHGASQPLTGAPYGWGGVNWGDCCLTWETPVWGPHGSKPIGLLRPGDQVWSFVDGKIEAHAVTAQWFSKRQDVFKVRTRHRSVTGSANHPFLRVVETAPAKPRSGRRGWDSAEYGVEWARLDELRKGDLLVQPKAVRLDRDVSNTLPSGREIGLNEAWLLGVILGDGNVSDTRVEVCVYGGLRDRVRSVLDSIRLDASPTRRSRVGIGSTDSDEHGIRAYSTQFARELDEAGFRKPAHEKSIPECVWSWDEDRQRAFLNGYCDADGHHPANVARHGERSYASSSRRLIEDVRYLHITLGDVVANVSTNGRGKPIDINGKRVKNARPLYSISVRPDGEELVASVAAMRRAGVAEWVASGDFTVAPILDVTPMGEEDTYDIEVAGSANFIAGGVVVHNSGAMSAFTRAAAGLSPFGGRWSTGSAAGDLLAMGFQRGRGGPGDMRIGLYNGGPGGGHTAGTLPDGTNVEMGGGNGGGMVGGSVGADNGQFTDHYFRSVPSGDPAPAPEVPPTTETTPSTTTPVPEPTRTEPAGDTISSRFGNAASAAVAGQVQDILGVFGINDSPAALGAYSQFEQARKERRDRDKQDRDSKESKSTDPGTHKPKEGEDLGVGKALSGVEAIKAAFKQGLREAWRTGAPWDATDWIVNKESTWNPKARNGKYSGLGQLGPDAWKAAGIAPSDDPLQQAKAYDHYVGGRYGDPMKAKEFWQANNWYDRGGVAAGVGHMLKNTLRPERVLSPKQTEAFEHGMRRGFGADPEMAGLMRELVDLMRNRSGGDVNIHNPVYRNESEAVRAQRDFVSRQLMRTGG